MGPWLQSGVLPAQEEKLIRQRRQSVGLFQQVFQLMDAATFQVYGAGKAGQRPIDRRFPNEFLFPP